MTASTCNIRNFNRIDHYFVPLRKQRGAVQRAKRSLFGPIDHRFNEQWIQEQLTKQLIEDSFKYGIDFSDGRIIKLRGLKRPRIFDENNDDDKNVEQYYFQPIEPDNNNNNKSKSSKNLGKQEVLLSSPSTSSSSSSSTSSQTISGSTIRKSVKQSLLTDFMQSKKPCSNNVLLLKKDQTERPNKIFKLTDNVATTTNS